MARASLGTYDTDSSTETSARDARARAWIYLFECYERKMAEAGSAACTLNEAKGVKHVRSESGTQG
jgi:hypothetical protein